MARTGHGPLSDLSPLSGVKRKSNLGAVLARSPILAASRYHAVAVVQLGKLTEARETILRALEANPDAAFSMIGRYFRHQWVHDLYIGALHPVILPELA